MPRQGAAFTTAFWPEVVNQRSATDHHRGAGSGVEGKEGQRACWRARGGILRPIRRSTGCTSRRGSTLLHRHSGNSAYFFAAGAAFFAADFFFAIARRVCEDGR